MKKINKKATIQNILNKCNNSIGFSINVAKFNAMDKTDKFLIECSEFCHTEIVYLNK